MTFPTQKWLGIGMVMVVLGIGIWGLSATAFGAPRATILVTTDVDVVANDGLCSLREAIRAANNNSASGSQIGECAAGDTNDTIQFTPDFITYTLALAGTNENAALSGDLDIINSVTIQGNGITGTVLAGDSIDRVFHILNGAVVIEALTITQGKAPTLDPDSLPAIEMSGGGILNQATLTLRNVALYDNEAGSISASPYFGSARGGDGGGVASIGTLIIENSTLSGNRTGQSGYSDSSNQSGWGGGIYSSGTLTVASSTIADNRAVLGVGGLNRGGNGGNGGGIAIAQGNALIADSNVNENDAEAGGSGTAPASSKGGDGGVGGGIYVGATSTVTLLRSTVEANMSGDGGWNHESPSGKGGDGGGIYADATATLTVLASTIAANRTGLTIEGMSGSGGGIFSLASLYVDNSTISGNRGEDTGGGVYADDALIRNSTIAYNTAVSAGGGGIGGAQNTVGNVIINNNFGGTSNECTGSLISEGYNLIFQPTCTITGTTNTNIYDQAAQLSPLALNGGTTETHAISPISPALDAGNCFGTLRDQRGLPRFVDNPTFPNVSDGCDMGAYEAQNGTPPTATPSSTAGATLTPTPSPTVGATLTPTASPTFVVTVTLVPPRSALFLPLIQRDTTSE